MNTKLNNTDIRLYAKGRGVPLWKIADAMGKCELTITRLMRKELSNEKKAEIIKIIDGIAEGE